MLLNIQLTPLVIVNRTEQGTFTGSFCRALARRGFTLRMYTDWIKSYEPVPAPSDFYTSSCCNKKYCITLQPYLPKRWLVPGNESALISLFRARSIDFLPDYAKDYFPAHADFVSAARYFSHPGATTAWPLTILEINIELLIVPEYSMGFLEIMRIAVERSDISVDFLSQLFIIFQYPRMHEQVQEDEEQLLEGMGQIAFRSGRKDVVDWALEHGFAPTAEILRELFPGDGNA